MSFKKLTEEYVNECGYDIDEMFLSEKVYNTIYCEPLDWHLCLVDSIVDCESPMEQYLSLFIEVSGLIRINRFNPKIDIVEFEKQKELIINGKKYRVDFFMKIEYKIKYKDFKTVNLIIEVDGHEFHQKTKEQVERDNERTRKLQIAGYEIIKFSGTEVYRKPNKCIDTLFEIILSKSYD